MFQQQPAQTLAAPRPTPSLFLLLAAVLLLGACTASRPSEPAQDLLHKNVAPGQDSPRVATAPPVYDYVLTGGTDPDAIEVNGSDVLYGDGVGTYIYAAPPHPEDVLPDTSGPDDLYGSPPEDDILGPDHIVGSGRDVLYEGPSDDIIGPHFGHGCPDVLTGGTDPDAIVPCPCLDAWLAIPGNVDRIFDDPTCDCSGSGIIEDTDDKPAGE